VPDHAAVFEFAPKLARRCSIAEATSATVRSLVAISDYEYVKLGA
jgi:hypothetical protein